jgi:hypothetical protein
MNDEKPGDCLRAQPRVFALPAFIWPAQGTRHRALRYGGQDGRGSPAYDQNFSPWKSLAAIRAREPGTLTWPNKKSPPSARTEPAEVAFDEQKIDRGAVERPGVG